MILFWLPASLPLPRRYHSPIVPGSLPETLPINWTNGRSGWGTVTKFDGLGRDS